MEENNNEEKVVATVDASQDLQTEFKIPDELPLLPVRDIVIFPYMILPLFVGRESSINAVNEALASDRMILLVAQKDAGNNEPKPEDLYNVGTVVMVIRMLKLPDGRVKILVQGLSKAKIISYAADKPFYKVKVERIKEPSEPKEKSLKTEALMRNVRDQLEKAISLGKMLPPDLLVIADNLDSPGKLADLAASNLGLKVEEAQQILEILDHEERLNKVGEFLGKEVEVLTMQQKIQFAAQEEMTKTQKEYFLREQLKAIQKELGDIDEKTEEINEFKKKIADVKMPNEVEKEALKQLDRLAKMHPEAAEATTVRTYLEWMVELPWSKATADNLNIKGAAKVLEEDHYDLEKVKERILEYLAVRKLKAKMKGPILCFVGPPGVGKTSLGKSIARALGRQFVRISLGGVRDEAEIRGHRRTYIGSLPGRIIQGIKQAGSNNPVFMMDEVDKIGADFRGDPSAALLEVLDPEQNYSFSDHYLGVPFDLSNVMFITTANLTDPIPSALKDRMEIISLSGYTEEEKLGIAKKYLIPRQMEEHGIKAKQIHISDEAVLKIISQYTREAGLRNLEREIATICRKVAKDVAQGNGRLHRISAANLNKFLGIRKFLPETEAERNQVGVATGLAWTQAGGEIMHIEVTTMKGRGALTLTGQLGDVMKESAQAAMSYARSKSKNYGLKEDFYQKIDVHIHVPAGAIPKDGPSAGITMATALISKLTGIPVRKDVAMTGEITLTGRVLPIGGLKEKSLAAKRAGIMTIIIPKDNNKDLEEIPSNIMKDMKFILAKEMDDVVKNALLFDKEKKQRIKGKPRRSKSK
ncbi:MAG: endopeptidase La [Nitrospinae bacterium RIFCSPLOWO2_12_39_16]|nr:MAG: endopeptidase La [Nitrospinae bacterium RIFCSPLOWO2_12_39_16]